MMHLQQILLVLILSPGWLALIPGVVLAQSSIRPAGSSAEQQKIEIREGDRILLLGGTNMVRLHQAGYFETILTREFADRTIKFRDLSWEGDTVFRQGSAIERWRKDGFGELPDQLKQLEPDVIFLMFGQLETIGPETVSDEQFCQAYLRLIALLKKQTERIHLVAPVPFEKPLSHHLPDLADRNRVLDARLEKVRNKAGLGSGILRPLVSDRKRWTENGMHVAAERQKEFALALARGLGIQGPWTGEHERLLPAVREKNRLWYDYWRPANWKLLYGDDSRREFTKASDGQLPFRQEWKKLLPMIETAEKRIRSVASGKPDPGHARPRPEKLHADETANIERELASFRVAEGLKVNLFASEREGLTSPLAIRWDPSGRAYVSVTTTYPHVFPGDVPNDRIYILEDLDRDGIVDRSTLFADGLNIPTAMELGDGGVYVGQNTELLFLKDTDGDDRADVRKVLLSGFGNGDSHQTINSFVWSPGGELFMGQGDGIESRVETPWGSADLFQSGFYRLRPRRLRLDPLLDDFMGPGNPWGVNFDDWGQIFSIDGAGGVTHLSLGQVPVKHRSRLGRIGDPGGYCGIAHLDGRHLPSGYHGQFAIGDFKANRVKCFSVAPRGATFQLKWEQPLVHSSHRNFRPVDVRMGPDGAVYIVDWYNPITCHQDDRYRDPRRDKAHGRIWRVSSDRPTVDFPDLKKSTTQQVAQALASPERWTRYQAKREITCRDDSEVTRALKNWIRQLDPRDEQYEFHLVQALGAFATIEVPNRSLLVRLLEAKDPRARALACRVAGRWQDRLDDAAELLASRTSDSQIQVRMEAVAAASQLTDSRAITTIARAFDFPVDGALDYVINQAIRHTARFWESRIGQLEFDNPSHATEVLTRMDSRGQKELLIRTLQSDEPHSIRLAAISRLLLFCDFEEVVMHALKREDWLPGSNADAAAVEQARLQVLKAVLNVARNRIRTASSDVAVPLEKIYRQGSPKTQALVLRIGGTWRVSGLESLAAAALNNREAGWEVRRAAMWLLARMGMQKERLVSMANTVNNPTRERMAALEALAELDLVVATAGAADLLADPRLDPVQTQSLLKVIIGKKQGPTALAEQLRDADLDPRHCRRLLSNLFALGRTDPVVVHALNEKAGLAAGPQEFNRQRVEKLARSSLQKGDPKRGKQLFETLACPSCHQTAGRGGSVGPDLTSLGTTLSTDRIIEELLWPNRQIKEGYSVVQVATLDGLIFVGYRRRTRESEKTGDVVLQELDSRKMITIPKEDIETQKEVGSPMPEGLTRYLTSDQLDDLVRYLTGLGKLN
ncbi:MAG: PVC-type heme-binding CxxCH protein [Planctomycetota bacterium]|nr:PVC-type heme-binding CxxCH protein [Planctomycetota bacterium]